MLKGRGIRKGENHCPGEPPQHASCGSFTVKDINLAEGQRSEHRARLNTHIFKPVLAELNHQVQEDQPGEPEAPHDHLSHGLDVEHAENENELVENKIPELVFEVLKRERFTKVSTIPSDQMKRS